MSLPAADDLFRPTTPETGQDPSSVPAPAPAPAAGPAAGGTEAQPGKSEASEPERRSRPSGRVRHDEKMTVYVTAEELLDLEHARLMLRRHHGLAVDRGRLVREAVAIALADLDGRGGESLIVQRLQQP